MRQYLKNGKDTSMVTNLMTFSYKLSTDTKIDDLGWH